MKNGLLSIGEFAKLRDINVKSLRYYEKIGALTPAYINPETGYRYYSINQLSNLDVVLTLIELGIPLKEIARYANPSDPNSINSLDLIEQGKEHARDRIARAQEQLLQLENYADELAAFGIHSSNNEPYTRAFEKRLCLCQKLPLKFDMTNYAQSTNWLYDTASSLGLVPMFSQGIIAGKIDALFNSFARGSKSEYFTYLHVMPSPSIKFDFNAVLSQCRNLNASIAYLPASTYSCKLIRSKDFNESFELGLDELHESSQLTVMAEAWSAMLNPDEFLFEIQIPQDN